MSFATQYNRVKQNIADAYSAIENRGGADTLTPNSENLAAAINTIPSGIDINGVIEQYTITHGNSISPGDFVEYLNKIGSEQKISSETQSGLDISAVALSENKVFIAHKRGSSSYNYLYGMVCTISGTTITAGTDIQLSANENSSNNIFAVALSENKVFIAHAAGGSYSTNLYGMVCTISGTTITVGTDTRLSNSTGSSSNIFIVALSENKVIITHRFSSSNNYLYGMVCTISGTIITKGTDTQLSTTDSINSIAKLSETKVLIFNIYGQKLYGMLCTIDGTTITAGTNNQLSTNTVYNMYTAALSENKVFVAYSVGSNRYLYGMICTVNETTITTGTDTQLSTVQSSGSKMLVATINENKILIIYGISNYLYEMICTITGLNLTVENSSALNNDDNDNAGNSFGLAFLKSSKACVFYRTDTTNNYLSGIIHGINSCSKVIDANQLISGLAKTGGSVADTIQVYVPDVS